MGINGMLKYDTVESEVICPRCKSIFTNVQHMKFPATYYGSCYQCGLVIEESQRVKDIHTPITQAELNAIWDNIKKNTGNSVV